MAATAINVRHLLSQVAVNPSQLNVEPSQVAEELFQVLTQPPAEVAPMDIQPDPTATPIPLQSLTGIVGVTSKVAVNPSQLIVDPSQVAEELFQVLTQPPAEVASMDVRPGPTATPVPLQSLTGLVSVTSNSPMPKAQYHVRNQPSGKTSCRDSIDGAPAMTIDSTGDEQGIAVDIRDCIDVDGDDDYESHVSSSQKTTDGCGELLPPPGSHQRHATGAGNVSQPKLATTHTLPELDIDEEDLPAWMVKKGQWRYVTSTPGGTAWENLLKAYMNQERRFEFTETVSNFTCIFPCLATKPLIGHNSHTRVPTVKDQRVFPVRPRPVTG